jgi:hypothetical protein
VFRPAGDSIACNPLQREITDDEANDAETHRAERDHEVSGSDQAHHRAPVGASPGTTASEQPVKPDRWVHLPSLRGVERIIFRSLKRCRIDGVRGRIHGRTRDLGQPLAHSHLLSRLAPNDVFVVPPVDERIDFAWASRRNSRRPSTPLR